MNKIAVLYFLVICLLACTNCQATYYLTHKRSIEKITWNRLDRLATEHRALKNLSEKRLHELKKASRSKYLQKLRSIAYDLSIIKRPKLDNGITWMFRFGK